MNLYIWVIHRKIWGFDTYNYMSNTYKFMYIYTYNYMSV